MEYYDVFEKHRSSSRRGRENAFEEGILKNCKRVVSHSRLRSVLSGKVRNIVSCISRMKGGK
jgi:hypothetical protein